MRDERILTESRSLRDALALRTDALDRVKALELLPDGLYLTTELVAYYFEVSHRTVENLLKRHRCELEDNGLRVISGAELREYQTLNMRVSSGKGSQSCPQRRSGLALYTRRTVLMSERMADMASDLKRLRP